MCEGTSEGYIIDALLQIYRCTAGNNSWSQVLSEYNTECIQAKDCEWSDWSEYSSCSVKCGNGTSNRVRLTIASTGIGSDCIGEDSQLIPCQADCGGFFYELKCLYGWIFRMQWSRAL